MSKRRATRAASAQESGRDAMTTHHLALDRFEQDRDGAELAVLVTDDGRSIIVPQAFLPTGATAGMTLTWTLALDPAATAAVARETAAIRADLKKTDPGGTIKL